jgi:hypothetical protein
MQSYNHYLPDTSLSPEAAATRWGTWIEAVNFCSDQFETVKSVVAKFPSESAVSERESQNAFCEPEVACSIAYIRSNFTWLLENIRSTR